MSDQKYIVMKADHCGGSVAPIGVYDTEEIAHEAIFPLPGFEWNAEQELYYNDADRMVLWVEAVPVNEMNYGTEK